MPPNTFWLSTIWTGHEVVVSDGASDVYAYDPAQDRWRTLPSLEDGATATSLAYVDGSIVAVYRRDGALIAARFDGTQWNVIAREDNSPVAEPVVVDAGGSLVVIDRSGASTPVAADESLGRIAPLAGYPLAPGVEGNAVWAGNGLFVWGGLPSGVPATLQRPDADNTGRRLVWQLTQPNPQVRRGQISADQSRLAMSVATWSRNAPASAGSMTRSSYARQR